MVELLASLMFHLSLVLHAVDPAVGDVLTAVEDPAVGDVLTAVGDLAVATG